MKLPDGSTDHLVDDMDLKSFKLRIRLRSRRFVFVGFVNGRRVKTTIGNNPPISLMKRTDAQQSP